INNEQIASFVRQMLLVGSGFMIARGFGTAETWAMIAPAIVAMVTAAWGFWARTDKNLIKSAADVPVVTQIAVNPAPAVVARAQVIEEPVAMQPVPEAWNLNDGIHLAASGVKLVNLPLGVLLDQLPSVISMLGELQQATRQTGTQLQPFQQSYPGERR
ncbi:MAG: hypothetical protein H0W86_14395, partial [Armatimonadetes bacterium]|nr:hypothetical protein [Armatimonadota bacterium]